MQRQCNAKKKCHVQCNVTVPPTPEAYRFHEETTRGRPSRGSLLAPAWSHPCRAWEMRVTERREEWLVRARAPRTLQILPHVMADLQTRPSANDNEYQSLDAQFSRAEWEKASLSIQFLRPPFHSQTTILREPEFPYDSGNRRWPLIPAIACFRSTKRQQSTSDWGSFPKPWTPNPNDLEWQSFASFVRVPYTLYNHWSAEKKFPLGNQQVFTNGNAPHGTFLWEFILCIQQRGGGEVVNLLFLTVLKKHGGYLIKWYVVMHWCKGSGRHGPY